MVREKLERDERKYVKPLELCKVIIKALQRQAAEKGIGRKLREKMMKAKKYKNSQKNR